jgi:glucose/arabinose dehydrogenase
MNLGKVVRLNDDGSVPSDNPMAAKGGVTAQIYAYGIRNPLGLAFDGAGRLWEVEMGPRHGDELNLVTPGANFGYPNVSNGDHYDGRDIPDHKPGDGYVAPKVFWNPAISPGGMMIYQGAAFPKWKGDAFIGALGGKALVRGELTQESWEDKETGKRQSKTRVEVTDWEFAGGKREDGQSVPPAPRAQKPQAQAQAPTGEVQPEEDDVPF